MIARIWDGRTPAAKVEAYKAYLKQTGIPDYKATPGNRGVLMLVRIEGEIAHFRLITLWESYEAIRRFAGEPLDTSRYYPEDVEFLLDQPPKVLHYEVAAGFDLDGIPESIH